MRFKDIKRHGYRFRITPLNWFAYRPIRPEDTPSYKISQPLPAQTYPMVPHSFGKRDVLFAFGRRMFNKKAKVESRVSAHKADAMEAAKLDIVMRRLLGATSS